MTPRRVQVHESQTNVFIDLGLPDVGTQMLKAEIVAELYRLTKERKLTQTGAGHLMGLTQPEVSRLFKGVFREYPVERLMSFLTAFDYDVEIISRPHSSPKTHAQISFRLETAEKPAETL